MGRLNDVFLEEKPPFSIANPVSLLFCCFLFMEVNQFNIPLSHQSLFCQATGSKSNTVTSDASASFFRVRSRSLRKADDAVAPIQQLASQIMPNLFSYLRSACGRTIHLNLCYNFFDEFGWHDSVGCFPLAGSETSSAFLGYLVCSALSRFLSELTPEVWIASK